MLSKTYGRGVQKREVSLELENVELIEFFASLSLTTTKQMYSMQRTLADRRANVVVRLLATLSAEGMWSTVLAREERAGAGRRLGSETVLV